MPFSTFSLGSSGTGLDKFNNPKGVAVHYNTGNIFVVDTGNNRIKKYTRVSGSIPTWPISIWGTTSPGSGDGQFDKPWAIAVDPSSSDVYVSDKGNNRIQKFTVSGQFITKFVGIWSTGMAVDSYGNFYASVSYKNKIYKLTPKLETISIWGHQGTANGEFDNPHGITVDTKNDIYVVDTGNFRIQKFTKDGQHIASWTLANSGGGVFRIPYGIAFDRGTNSVHVSDNSLHTIQTFTQNGGFIQKKII